MSKTNQNHRIKRNLSHKMEACWSKKLNRNKHYVEHIQLKNGERVRRCIYAHALYMSVIHSVQKLCIFE